MHVDAEMMILSGLFLIEATVLTAQLIDLHQDGTLGKLWKMLRGKRNPGW